MKNPVIIIGMGEMAGVFARAFLRSGYPVIPVLRDSDIAQISQQEKNPSLVLVAVGEKDLHATLQTLAKPWQTNLVLLQNELLPRDWQQYDLEPTVISVWFEKKKGQDYKVLVPSPVFGKNAHLINEALNTLDIPSVVLDNAEQLLFELIRKNVYILTTNIAGLVSGGNVKQLWDSHQSLAKEVATEIMDIQDWLTQTRQDRDKLLQAVLDAFNGDPEHKCMGRSAPARLANAIEHAKKANIRVNKLQQIANET